MAAVAGILGQELLGVQPVWFDAGSKEYIFPATALTAIEFLTLGALELKRYRGWKEHKTVSLTALTLEIVCSLHFTHETLMPFTTASAER